MHRVDRSSLRRLAAMAIGAATCAVVTLLSGVDAVLASAGAEESVSDPERTRVVTVAVVVMIAAGVLVLAVTVWFWRSTRPEPPVLGPLEVMGERRFVRADHDEQQRRLDRVRPPGAEAEEPAAAVSAVLADPPAVDGGAEAGAVPATSVADETAPGDAAPAPAAPDETALDETAPDETAPDETAPEGVVSGEVGPGAVASDSAISEDADHTPDGGERPSADGDEASAPAIDPLLGRFP